MLILDSFAAARLVRLLIVAGVVLALPLRGQEPTAVPAAIGYPVRHPATALQAAMFGTIAEMASDSVAIRVRDDAPVLWFAVRALPEAEVFARRPGFRQRLLWNAALGTAFGAAGGVLVYSPCRGENGLDVGCRTPQPGRARSAAIGALTGLILGGGMRLVFEQPRWYPARWAGQ